MESITKKIGNAKFEFLVNSRGNRSGFVHECELYMNGEQISRHKCQYYNRTWERYRFQTVMLGAVDRVIEQTAERIREAEKDRRGWRKLTQQRRNEIGQIIAQNSAYKILRALREDVSAARWGTESDRHKLETLDALNAILEILFDRRGAEKNA